MKGVLTALLLCGSLLLSGISIFQIQYTTDAGRDNTFPSVYVGKSVTVEGIVTASNYQNGGFFISENAGGPWRSIYIRSENDNIQPGDKVIIKGTVAEYFGMTCIQNLSRISVIDSHRPIPFANQIATGQITTPEQAEAYESVLVKVQNATCVQNQSGTSAFIVNDGSGPCNVRASLTSEKTRLFKSGDVFASLTGIVCYAYGEYSINPRNRFDVSVMIPVFNQNRSWGRIKSIYK
jgi:DNA/RNA endonuclease YhcR with UshA esterase domain